MDFMKLRTESTLTMLSVKISTESIYRSEYLCRSGCVGVSNVPSTYVGMQSSTAVLHWGNDVACMPRHHLPRVDESSGLDTRLASGLCAGQAQSTCIFLPYRDIGLRHSPLRVYGPMRSTHNASRGVVMTSFGGTCPYFWLCLLFTWQDLQDLTYDWMVLLIPFQYITESLFSSRREYPGCWR